MVSPSPRLRVWFDELRACRTLLEQALADGRDPEAARRLALVLREQYLLAPGIPGLRPQDERELRRLQELIDHEDHAWTSR